VQHGQEPGTLGSGLPRPRRGTRAGVPNAVRPCFADHPSKAKRVPPLAAGPRPWTLGVRTAEALGTRPRLVRDPALASEPADLMEGLARFAPNTEWAHQTSAVHDGGARPPASDDQR